MSSEEQRTIVVIGATGLQGGAVARRLLQERWRVRAFTRSPASGPARTLAALGATVVKGDMSDVGSLQSAFEGAHGVYSMQTPFTAGPETEVQQGKNVGEAARAAGVKHLVYASAGTGQETGVRSWDSKLRIEQHLKALGLPLTIFRPTAFMEILSDKKFFPPLAAWHVMPALMGAQRKVSWIAVDDLGAVAAKAFGQPETFVGKELNLASDERSIDECRTIHREVFGKDPPRFRIPAWLFACFGFAGRDLSRMWRWCRDGILHADVSATRAIHPAALTVAAWMQRRTTKAARG
jgi:uncharacterized protein YbjT (DUF2867 family)